MSIQRTLSIVKPDAVAKNVIGEIYSRFEKAVSRDAENLSASQRSFTGKRRRGRTTSPSPVE